MNNNKTWKEFTTPDFHTTGAALETEATPQKNANGTPKEDLSFNIMEAPNNS